MYQFSIAFAIILLYEVGRFSMYHQWVWPIFNLRELRNLIITSLIKIAYNFIFFSVFCDISTLFRCILKQISRIPNLVSLVFQYEFGRLKNISIYRDRIITRNRSLQLTTERNVQLPMLPKISIFIILRYFHAF